MEFSNSKETVMLKIFSDSKKNMFVQLDNEWQYPNRNRRVPHPKTFKSLIVNKCMRVSLSTCWTGKDFMFDFHVGFPNVKFNFMFYVWCLSKIHEFHGMIVGTGIACKVVSRKSLINLSRHLSYLNKILK